MFYKTSPRSTANSFSCACSGKFLPKESNGRVPTGDPPHQHHRRRRFPGRHRLRCPRLPWPPLRRRPPRHLPPPSLVGAPRSLRPLPPRFPLRGRRPPPQEPRLLPRQLSHRRRSRPRRLPRLQPPLPSPPPRLARRLGLSLRLPPRRLASPRPHGPPLLRSRDALGPCRPHRLRGLPHLRRLRRRLRPRTWIRHCRRPRRLPCPRRSVLGRSGVRRLVRRRPLIVPHRRPRRVFGCRPCCCSPCLIRPDQSSYDFHQ